MKIQIREKGGIHLTLLFPSSLVGFIICSRVTRKIILKVLHHTSLKTAQGSLPKQASSDMTAPDESSPTEEFPELKEIFTDEVLKKFQKEFKKVLKNNHHLTLMDIESANGDHVKVVL